MRLRVTRLEPRRVLNASPLVPVQDPSDVTADATAAAQADDLAVVIDAGSQANDGVADTFHIYRSGDGIGVSVDGHEVFAGKLAPSQSLAIHGSADADHLIVHLGTRGLPAAQIDFDGGDAASGHDLLELRGSTGQVSHVVMPQGEGVTTAGGTSISYSGVEQLHDVVNASVRELRLEQMNSAVIAGSGPNELRLETADFRLDMARPHDHFAVDLREGAGTRLQVHEFGSDVAFDFSVDADAQDAVSITGNFDFGHHDVALRGGEIAIDGSIHSDGGRLTFEADSRLSLYSDGSLASAGGFVKLNAGEHGTLLVAGSIDVADDSPNGNGGEVHLLGERVVLTSTADVDATGTHGGGTILVGGDYQGSNEHVLNAHFTQIARGAVLRADAVETGDGGRIIVWADVATAFAGAVIARGGRLSGNGGFAEVSGKIGLSLTGEVDLTAARGTTGVLLLDPDSISIVAAAGADDDELDDGVINAGDGGAGSTFVISDTKIESLAGTVILQATNSIVLGAGVELNLGSIVLLMQTTGIAGSITLDGTIVGNAGETLAVELIASSIAISATGGITGADSVSLTADDLAINGPVTAATEIAIETLSANRDIDFRADDAGAALKLTNAELTQLSAPVISFATSTGTVIISAPMALAGAGVTWIFAGESFDVTAAGSLTAVGNITVRTDNASLAGPIVASSATSQIAFEVKTSGRDIAVRDDAGGPAALKFSDVELDQLSAPVISFSTASGTVSVIDDASLAGGGVTWIFAGDSLQIAAGETLAASAGNLTIRADSMVLNGNATAATTLRVLSLSATRNIVLGMNSGSDLSLTDAELDNLSAPDVFVSGMATLTVAGDISVATNLHLTANTIAVDSNLTVTGAGNDLAITAQNAITLDADVTAAGDAIILANQDSLAAQSFTQLSGTLTAANVTIGVAGAGNASLADLQAGLGLVRVTTGGAILDSTASEAAALITAANAALRAGAGIGGGGNADIDLAVTNVAATTVIGGIFLQDEDALVIGQVDGLVGVTIVPLIAGTGGNITVAAGGTLTISRVVDNDGVGGVTLTGSGISLGENVSANGTVTFTGVTTLTTDITITSTAGGINFQNVVTADIANTHTLTLSAAGDINFDAAVGTTALQNLTITAAANVTFDSTLTLSQNFLQTAGTGTTTFSGGSVGGDLTVTTSGVTFSTALFTVGDAVGDDLTITADNAVALDANVTVVGNALILANQDDGGPQSFSQSSGTVLQAATITITVGVLNGPLDSGAADIALLQSAGLVKVTTHGGAIRDVNTSDDTVENIIAPQAVLRARAGIGGSGLGDVDLTVAGVAATTVTGGIFLSDANALIITTVDGLSGLSAGSGGGAIQVDVTSGVLLVAQAVVHNGTGNIALVTSGNAVTDDVVLNADVTANGGSIVIDSGHDITQAAVTVSTTGAGTISYVAAGAISLADLAEVNSVSGSVMISANGGNLAMADTSRVQSDGGLVLLSSSADVRISLVNANRFAGGAAGDVIVVADSDSVAGGAILDGRVGEGGGSLNIVAHDLLLSAATGIGSGSGALFELEDIDVMSSGNITADNRAFGAIQLLVVGDAALASVRNPGRTVVVESTPDSVPARHAAIVTAGANDEVPAENIVAGTAFLLARDGIGGPGASALTTQVGSLWASNVRSSHIGIVETDAINVVRMSQDRSSEPFTGDISLRAGGTIVVSVNGVSTDGSGSIALRSTGATGSSALVVNAPVVTKYTLGVGGPVILQANNIEIASAVGAAVGSMCSVVQIVPQTTAIGVSLGGETAGMLSLKGTELDLIATRVLTIGGRGVDATNLGNPASAGRITIVGDATPSGATHLVLLTNTDVFGFAGTVGVGGTLVIDAGTGVGGAVEGRLNTSAGTIVGRVRLPGGFQVLNSGPLTVGVTPVGPLTALGMTVPALQGIATANGSIFVGTAFGQLDVEQRIAAVGGASDLGLRAGTGDLVLGADVSAGRNVALVASGSIFESIDGISVRGLRASFWADNGDVGLFDNRLDVQVGIAAAQALMGSVYLHQAANPGDLSIGVVPAVLGLASIAGVQSGGTVIVTTTNGDLTVASPLSAFDEVRLIANGELNIANNVSSSGAATFIATTIGISDGALVSANTAALSATVGAINVEGDISTIGMSSLTAPRIAIGGNGSIDSGSTTLIASSTALLVDGSVRSAGTAVLSGFPVTVNGLVSGGTVTITAGSGTLTVGGRVEADSVATLVGPIIDVNRGVIDARSAVLSAGGPLTISGLVQTTLNATLSGTTITVSTGGTVSAGGTATFTAGTITTAQNSLIATGSVLINATAGAATLNGTVSATGVALISTTTSLVQTTGVIVASSAAINATFGVGSADAPVDLIVGTVAAKSVAGSVYVTQLAGMGLTIGSVAGQGGVPGASGFDAFGSVVVVTAQGAFTHRSVPLLLTGDAVGANALAVAAPIVARTGTVSLTAAQGSIVLAESTTARQSIEIETQAGDIVLGHRVVVQDPRTEAQVRADVSTLSISAKLPANSPVAGNVVFRGGYLRTPEGVVVDALRTPDPTPDLIEVDASRLATVIVDAGSVRQTVDGVLSDAGLRVDVDFRELREGGFQAKFASAISGDRLIFGPYSFEYSDEFLSQIFEEAGEEDSRFDVIITATQNSSIDVAEFLGDMRRVVTTEGTRQFLQPSVPLTQSLALVPVAIRYQPQSNFQFPEAPERASIFTDAVMPSVSAPEATPVLENADLIDITAASSGAAATDRPRLYLVWKLPGLEDQSGRKEFPIVVLAPRYLRALVAELPQGTYWFELQEPGADPRPISEKFYVRGGRIDVEVLPEDLGLVPHGLPHDNLHSGESVPVTVPIPDDSSDNGDDFSQSDREHSDEAQNAKTAQAETVAAAGASALGAVGLLKGRWRRRFEAATTAPTPNLRKVSRLSRKIRRAAR